MNKDKLDREMAHRTGLPVRDCQKVVRAMFPYIRECLERYGVFRINGFGRFYLIHYPEKPCVSNLPLFKGTMRPEQWRVRFRPAFFWLQNPKKL